MRVLYLCVLLLATACTPTISAQTLRFNKGLELGTGKTFALVAEDNQANDLEFNHYAELVSRGLQTHGLPQASSLASANYRVTFTYTTDEGTRVINNYPDYGVYGGYGSYGSSIGVGGTVYPRGGMSESYRFYTHRLELRIADVYSSPGSTVFQGRVSAEDSNPNITRIMPCLVAALFQSWPGINGVEQSVEVPATACF